MNTIEIKHKITGETLYTAIAKDGETLTVRSALEMAASAGSNLIGADLSGADLSGAYLIGSNLIWSDLSRSNLSGSNLIGADLSRANLSGANLIGADLSGANLSGANLIGAKMEGAPIIQNIHAVVYAAASAPGALNMNNWHCGTTHCRAGWVVTLAGEAGRILEGKIGTPAAAIAIYMASDPARWENEPLPDFYCGNREALADMKRMAEEGCAS